MKLMPRILVGMGLMVALKTTNAWADQPWSWVNVDFNSDPTNTAPPTSAPSVGVLTTNLRAFVDGTSGNTTLVQSRLGDTVHGLNDQPVVITHTNGGTTSYLSIYMSSSLGAGTLPTSGAVRVQWDYVNTASAYWGADMSLRRGATGNYQALLSIQDQNSGKDLSIQGGGGSLVFTSALNYGYATHFDAWLNLSGNSFTLSFSNALASGSYSDIFQNTNQATELGYFYAGISTTRVATFGLDNIVVAVPEPRAAELALMALGVGFVLTGFRGSRREAA